MYLGYTLGQMYNLCENYELQTSERLDWVWSMIPETHLYVGKTITYIYISTCYSIYFWSYCICVYIYFTPALKNMGESLNWRTQK